MRAFAARSTPPLVLAGAALALARWPAARSGLPVLGLLTGPLGVVLLAAAVLLVALRALPRPVPVPRAPGWLLFAVAAALLSGIGVRYVSRVSASGDELDYLLMAQSLWREGDLDMRDNYARGDHLEYTPGYDRMPGGGTRRADGRPYPTHGPGLPFLIAPVYALGGRAACCVLLSLVAAGLGLLVRSLARSAGANEESALVAWAAAVGPPVLFYTTFLYTEVPIAFALALALHLLLRSPGPAGAALAAIALSALPWLHVRAGLASAALGVFGLFQLRGRPRLAFAATAGAMALVYVAYFQHVFGTGTPLALYGGRMPGPMLRATPLRTLVGLFVDGGFGLLPYAPVFLLGLAGLGRLLGRGGRDRWAWGAWAFAVLLPVLLWKNWWGFSPPARFMVPLVPVLAVAAAARLGATPARGLAHWRWALVLAGLGLALLVNAEPESMHMVNMRGTSPHAFELLRGEVSLSRYLPFLSSPAGSSRPPWQPPATERVVAGVWVVALLMLLGLDRLARSRDEVDRWFRGLALPFAFLLSISIVIDRWVRPGGPPLR